MAQYPYQDSTLSSQVRAEDLLQRLSISEKVAQMSGLRTRKKELEDEEGNFNDQHAPYLMPFGIGHFARPSERAEPHNPNRTPRQTVRYSNALQHWLIHNTRWGIPALFHEEALHGHAARDSTSFPQAIALASSFNPELMEQAMSAAAREMRARGGHQAFSPILDVARDPRWGRIEETFGEDPYLITAFGIAAVRGLQGQHTGPIASDKVIATLKHLAGHGEPEGGLNTGPCNAGERLLREVFLAPFEACLKAQPARSVMASYNEIDGVPSHLNTHLLRTILRGEWQFNGTLISDYYALRELMNYHQISQDPRKIALLALNTGIQLDLPDGEIYQNLEALVDQGLVEESIIDTAVLRILRDKIELGIFENPYVDESTAVSVTGCREHRDLAYQAALQSLVLLKNHDHTLPLDHSKLKSVAVIGPHANDCLLGGYSDVPRHTVTILEGIKRFLEHSHVAVHHHLGCELTQQNWALGEDSRAANCASKERWLRDEVVWADETHNATLIQEAVTLAKQVDRVILVLGENEAICREAWSSEHLGDATCLRLAGQQQELLTQLLATGTTTILVLQNGRPLVLSDFVDDIPAIIEMWYLGQEGGAALADIVFGKCAPSGRLPVSFPRSEGQLPCYYNYKPSAKRGYIDDSTSPLFPFGHGLGYSTVEYSDLQILSMPSQENPTIDLCFRLRNLGQRPTTEVAQLYVRNRFSSVITRPVLELKGFHRCDLDVSEQVQIQFSLPVDMLGHYAADMKYRVDLGEVEVIVARSSSDHTLNQTLTIEQTFEICSSRRRYLCQSSSHPLDKTGQDKL